MTFDELKAAMPSFAKDTKLNLGRVLTGGSTTGLSEAQAFGTALASAYVTRNADVVSAVRDRAGDALTPEYVEAAKAAASVMGMNNVYYRFTHLVNDPEYAKMPANLRMNIIGNPGIDKVDFELMSLAVSAINGCGMCMEAHVAEVTKGGINRTGVQSAIRIGAVVNAAAQSLDIAALDAE